MNRMEQLSLNIHVVNENTFSPPVGEEWVLDCIYAKQFKTVINPLLVKFLITVQGRLPIEYCLASFNLHLFPLINNLVILKITPIAIQSQQSFKVDSLFPNFELLITGYKIVLL